MIAGTAPDVFTDHLAKYPEFASKNQLVDIQPYVDRDKVDMSVYLSDLADLWARNGKRFGLPKDWDPISIVYNKDMLDKAGVTVDEVSNATWNPDDGGTFAQLIAKLTLDENGKNALDPAFDKSKVAQYGLIINGAGKGYGQTEWSWLTNTTGWKHIDNLYATAYHCDDPRFIKTIQWYADMMAASKIMPLELVTSLGGSTAFNAGKGALHSNGSWMIGEFASKATFPVGFARLPQGPEGRKSMFNGLADSIWIGSKHPDQAWELVKYLASADCDNVVGDAGVVFPAQQSGVEKAIAAYKSRGLDVSAFTEQALELVLLAATFCGCSLALQPSPTSKGPRYSAPDTACRNVFIPRLPGFRNVRAERNGLHPAMLGSDACFYILQEHSDEHQPSVQPTYFGGITSQFYFEALEVYRTAENLTPQRQVYRQRVVTLKFHK